MTRDRFRSLQVRLALRLAAVYLVATAVIVGILAYRAYDTAETLNDRELSLRAADLARHVSVDPAGVSRLDLPPTLEGRRGGDASTPTQEVVMVRKSLIISISAAGILGFAGLTAWAGDDNEDMAALAKALLPGASIPLDQGIKAAEGEGKPISGKYEMDNGAPQLSVYTLKGDRFEEVVVDQSTGAITKAEAITDDSDLKDAREQGDAMAKARLTLDSAVQAALDANSGYWAVSVVPALSGDRPVATVSLMKGGEVKKVTEKLD